MALLKFKPTCKIETQSQCINELQKGHIRAENFYHAKLILSMQLAVVADELEIIGDIVNPENWALEEKGCVTAGWVKDKI